MNCMHLEYSFVSRSRDVVHWYPSSLPCAPFLVVAHFSHMFLLDTHIVLYLFPFHVNVSPVIIFGSCLQLDLILTSIFSVHIFLLLSVQLVVSYIPFWLYHHLLILLAFPWPLSPPPSYCRFIIILFQLCFFLSPSSIASIFCAFLFFLISASSLHILLCCFFLLWQFYQCPGLFMNHLLFFFLFCISVQKSETLLWTWSSNSFTQHCTAILLHHSSW